MSDEKKANPVARMGSRIARFVREMRSEMKKVVWPGRKQLVNNTMIVVVAVLVVGAVIAGFDIVCKWLLDSIVELLQMVV